MCGYKSFQDPRLAIPPEEPPEPEKRCGNCGHYTECERSQNGLDEVIGLCCIERDEDGTEGEVYYAEPDDTPEDVQCECWVER